MVRMMYISNENACYVDITFDDFTAFEDATIPVEVDDECGPDYNAPPKSSEAKLKVLMTVIMTSIKMKMM